MIVILYMFLNVYWFVHFIICIFVLCINVIIIVVSFSTFIYDKAACLYNGVTNLTLLFPALLTIPHGMEFTLPSEAIHSIPVGCFCYDRLGLKSLWLQTLLEWRLLWLLSGRCHRRFSGLLCEWFILFGIVVCQLKGKWIHWFFGPTHWYWFIYCCQHANKLQVNRLEWKQKTNKYLAGVISTTHVDVFTLQ